MYEHILESGLAFLMKKSKYTILDAAKDLVTGNLNIASDTTVAEREKICNGCEVQNFTTKICTACGCFIPAKVRLADASCPMELWSEE